MGLRRRLSGLERLCLATDRSEVDEAGEGVQIGNVTFHVNVFQSFYVGSFLADINDSLQESSQRSY